MPQGDHRKAVRRPWEMHEVGEEEGHRKAVRRSEEGRGEISGDRERAPGCVNGPKSFKWCQAVCKNSWRGVRSWLGMVCGDAIEGSD